MGMMFVGAGRERRKRLALFFICMVIAFVVMSSWAYGGVAGWFHQSTTGTNLDRGGGRLFNHSFCQRGWRSGALVDISHPRNRVREAKSSGGARLL